MGEQSWEVYDVNTGKTLEIVKGKSKGEVADQVYDKYVDQGIGFQIRPYVDPNTLTPRAKLAKRITEPKKTSNWDVVYTPTGRVIDSILKVDEKEAQSLLAKVAQQHDFANADNLEIRPQQAVQDVAPDVAQNFAEPTTYEIWQRNVGNPSALRRFQAATHPEAMAELERFRQSHPETAPHEFALRNLPA
jgi:hypothetical protein